MSEIVGNMETADPLDTSPKAECKVVLNTKRKIESGPLQANLPSYTSQTKEEIDKWTDLLEKSPIHNSPAVRITEDALTSDQFYFLESKVDGIKFARESVEFRNKYKYCIQVEESVLEKAADEKKSSLDEIHMEYCISHNKHMTYNPYIPSSPM